jgi:transcriptional regulator of acetoin/glycerol metabolism
VGAHVYQHDPNAGTASPGRVLRLDDAVREYEGLVLLCALEACNWNKCAAGRQLGITRQRVLLLCKKHNLHAPTKAELIRPTLEANGGNIRKTARQLRVSPSTVWKVAHGRD